MDGARKGEKFAKGVRNVAIAGFVDEAQIRVRFGGILVEKRWDE